jgi:hypothetical protein
MHEEGVADAVIAVDQIFEPLVDGVKHQVKLEPRHLSHQLCGVGLQLGELETAAQGCIEQGDRAIGRVHRAQYMQVAGNTEQLLGIGQAYFQRIGLAQALVGLDQGDELA